MRRLLAVSLWLIATAGVTYVASAAVTLVDLQVFPQGQRVEVLTRPAPPPTTTILPTSTSPGGATRTTGERGTTVPTTTIQSASPTTTVPTTTTSSGGGGGLAPTTTRPPATTTTRPPATTTTTRPVPPLVVETNVLAAATVGSGFEAALVATGGQRPHTWQMAGGVLPPGLSLSSAGRISGTPQAAGQFAFSIRVSDGSGRSATASFAVTTVNALRVLTTTLPEVKAGSAYQATLQATGGTSPYR